MDDLIRRADAIRIASGYCHWTNIPAELAKLPSVTPVPNVCKMREATKEEREGIEQYINSIAVPCEDAVSRQAVIELLNEYDPRLLMRSDYRKMVEDLPSVSAEKTGHWIPDEHPLASPHCSICNGYGYKTDAFCRTCGAKMEVEESESCKGCQNICIMYDQNMKGCKDKREGVEE